MNICAMLVKDLDRRVEGDYSNIEHLYKIGILNRALADKLKMCSGLRN